MTDPSHSHIKNWPECYGGDSVLELRTKGNPLCIRGAFGEISLALYRSKTVGDGIELRMVAVKTIMKSTVRDWGSTERKLNPDVVYELQALHKLSPHPNIVSLLALYPARDEPSGSTLSLAFEYCPTDLYLTMEWRRRSIRPLLSMETIKTIALDLFSALNHCHEHGELEQGILHRDIKPSNIIVSSAGVIKLCDFGLAKPFPDNDTMVTDDDSTDIGARRRGSRGVCTLHYRPPEVLMGGEADLPAVDVYSTGVVIAELLIGRTLFPGINELDQIAKVFDCLGTPSDTHWPEAKELPHGKLNFFHKDPRDITEFIPRCVESLYLVDFLRSCVSLDPSKRFSSHQAVSHPWLQSGLAPRSTLQEDLIPSALDEPFLLASSDGDITVATKQTLALASARRSFLKNLDFWKPDG